MARGQINGFGQLMVSRDGRGLLTESAAIPSRACCPCVLPRCNRPALSNVTLEIDLVGIELGIADVRIQGQFTFSALGGSPGPWAGTGDAYYVHSGVSIGHFASAVASCDPLLTPITGDCGAGLSEEAMFIYLSCFGCQRLPVLVFDHGQYLCGFVPDLFVVPTLTGVARFV